MLAKTVTNVKLKATEYGKMLLAMTVLLQAVELSEKCITELTVIQAKSGIELLMLVNETDKKLYCMNIVCRVSAEGQADLQAGLISPAGCPRRTSRDDVHVDVQAGLINPAGCPRRRESWHVLSLLEKQCCRAVDIWHVLALLKKQGYRVVDIWRVLSLLEKQRCGVVEIWRVLSLLEKQCCRFVDIWHVLFLLKKQCYRFVLTNKEFSCYEEKKNPYKSCRTSRTSRKDLQRK